MRRPDPAKRHRRFVVALIGCTGGGALLAPDQPARGMLIGALASILTWWAMG
jgi:hypothetical protein